MDPINFDSTPSLTTKAIHPMSTLGSSSSTVSQVIDNNNETLHSTIYKNFDAANDQVFTNS